MPRRNSHDTEALSPDRRIPPGGFISKHFYRQGLLCATYPRGVLLFTFVIIFGACYPLLYIPIYSGKAHTFVEKIEHEHNLKKHTEGVLDEEPPRWKTSQKPEAYIQQIILKSTVHPYRKEEMLRTDAFRAPLASAFKLHLDEVAAFRDMESGLDMDLECVRTDGISSRYKKTAAATILPDYGCLIVSPANLWKRDSVTFQLDPNIISTVFNFQHSREGHSSFTDLMFGMRQRETGMTKYPVRNRQRIIMYAVTVALKDHNPKFIEGLRRHLHQMYPLNVDVNQTSSSNSDEITHIYFPPHQFYVEFLPFAVTLLVLFLYVYFSCHKIELVRSKLGIALSAVFTVLGAVTMSLGLSGVSLNIHSKVYMVPYLVAFVSLENILIVTKSVMSTPSHLDSKIRVAQGLSVEGWNVTKNLCAEITFLTIGFLVGFMDYSIQEFCRVAVMGLLSDFFLQTFFFITILSMDIGQMELSDVLQKQPSPQRDGRLFQHPVSGPGHSKSVSATQKTVVAPQCNAPIQKKESKRVRLINFWARNRFIQRLFLIIMAVWMSTFIYQTSVLEVILKAHQDAVIVEPVSPVPNVMKEGSGNGTSHILISALNVTSSPHEQYSSSSGELISAKPNGLKRLEHRPQPWKNLPHTHWPMLFGLYNISLSGQYVSVLPPIRLSLAISPETARRLRHPQEAEKTPSDQTDSTEEADDELSDVDVDDDIFESQELNPFALTSPGELILAFIFVFPSIVFITYLVVLLYRCVCSRNYAEWRSSCFPDRNRLNYTHVIHDTVPIPLEGHQHEIECLHSADNLVVSLCLGGKIYTWDSQSGEKYSEMDRSQFLNDTSFNPPKRNSCSSEYYNLSNSNNIRNVPVQTNGCIDKNFVIGSADFSTQINTNFTSIGKSSLSNGGSKEPFNFSRFIKNNPTVSSSDDHVENFSNPTAPSVWSLDCNDRFIVLGCSSGRIEVWEIEAGAFQCCYDDGSGIGITHLRVTSCGEFMAKKLKLVIARLNGHLEFLSLVSSNETPPRHPYRRSPSDPVGPSSRRCHIRNHSSGSSLDSFWSLSSIVDVELLQQVRAHSQPVLCMEIRGGKVLTGSQDHTLRVIRLDDHLAVYTLHGHCSPVTSTFIDAIEPSRAGSGSQNGMLCVWDLFTGACLFSVQAHDGAVLSLTYSPSYVVSMGGDDKLCVWEREQGHLINSISLMSGPYCHDLIMLTHNLLVTARKGFLVVWDVRLPDPVRHIKLGDVDATQTVTLMTQLGDTIACSFGNQIRLIHFPMLTDKED